MNFLLGFLVFTLSLGAKATPSEPTVFSLQSSDVSGYFMKNNEDGDDTKIDIKPGPGIRCSLEASRILEHGAPQGYEGWRLEWNFTHPELDESDKDPFRMLFFWNAQKFNSPFENNFFEKFIYFEPFIDFPIETTSKFNAHTRTLTSDLDRTGGLISRQLRLVQSADSQSIEKAILKITVLGAPDQEIQCAGQAHIAGGNL